MNYYFVFAGLGATIVGVWLWRTHSYLSALYEGLLAGVNTRNVARSHAREVTRLSSAMARRAAHHAEQLTTKSGGAAGKNIVVAREIFPAQRAIATQEKALEAQLSSLTPSTAAQHEIGRMAIQYNNAIRGFPTCLAAWLLGFRRWRHIDRPMLSRGLRQQPRRQRGGRRAK